jgi:hypothetical protein
MNAASFSFPGKWVPDFLIQIQLGKQEGRKNNKPEFVLKGEGSWLSDSKISGIKRVPHFLI